MNSKIGKDAYIVLRLEPFTSGFVMNDMFGNTSIAFWDDTNFAIHVNGIVEHRNGLCLFMWELARIGCSPMEHMWYCEVKR